MDEKNDIFGIQPLSGGDLDNKYKESEISGEIISPGKKKDSLKKSISNLKIHWLLTAVGLLFFIIFFKLVNLQIVHGESYRDKAENNRIKIETLKALRGVIYDQTGQLLVKNSPNFTLYFTPSELPKDSEHRDVSSKISEVINMPVEEITNILNSADTISSQPTVIKEYIEYDQALKLKILLNNYPYLELRTLAIREYLAGESFSHLLGYMGKINQEELDLNEDYTPLDYMGKTGLEKYYEKELKGIDGKQQIERDNLNNIKRILATKDSIPGSNLVLSVRADLQNSLYDALESSVKSNNGTGGAAVAINPNNGEILALVSYPSYDNNLFFKGISPDEYKKITEDPRFPLIMRAISGEYPPGSTIKPAVASAALEEQIINSSTSVLSTGGIRIDKWYFPDWKSGGHGQTNVIKAIAESVNTFFYAISGGYEDIDGLGIDMMNYYFKQFGFSEALNIDIPGESTGFLPTKEWKESVKNERWYVGDTYHVAIGQGDILVTPLQIAAYTAALANGGTLYKPHIVKEFSDIENKTVSTVPKEVIREDFISDKNINLVRQGLREAVISGSARSLSSLPFSVAGKTGSAQYAKNKKTHAWFTSFAPYENPEIVITVIVESGGEGHVAALPVARAGLLKFFEKK